MGVFVAASAFRTEDAEAVKAAVEGFFAVHGQPIAAAEGPIDKDDVTVYRPENGWTTVIWPTYFIELAAVEQISRELKVHRP